MNTDDKSPSKDIIDLGELVQNLHDSQGSNLDANTVESFLNDLPIESRQTAMSLLLLQYTGSLARLPDELTRYMIEKINETHEKSVDSRKTLEEHSTTDALTEVYNRRHLSTTINRELAELSRQPNYSFSLILLDIDHFKPFNDKYGHNAGDAVLKKIGGILRGHMRKLDAPFRYGGEEFVVLLPYTGLREACKVAFRLKEEISKKPIIFNGETGEKNQETITASCGVAEIKQDLRLSLLYGRAGRALIGQYLVSSPEEAESMVASYVDGYLSRYDRPRNMNHPQARQRKPTKKRLAEAIKQIGNFVKEYYQKNSLNPLEKGLDQTYEDIGFEWVLKKADDPLYHAKDGGRNKVAYPTKQMIKLFKMPGKQ